MDRYVEIYMTEWRASRAAYRAISRLEEAKIWSAFNLSLYLTLHYPDNYVRSGSYDFRRQVAHWDHGGEYTFANETPGFIVFGLVKAGLVEAPEIPEVNDG